MRIVFFMTRPGHVRNYDETLRTLAARGHTIHLAFSSMRPKQGEPPDLPQAETLARDCPAVTFSRAPRREPDGWDRLAKMIRVFGDFARFLHPRYEHAQLLRDRAAGRLTRTSRLTARPSVASVCVQAAAATLGRCSSSKVADTLTRACRLGERAIAPSGAIVDYLKAEQADLVLVTPGVEIGSSQVEYFKAARKLGLPSALCVASWDNLTNKGVLRVEPDLVFVWNEIQRREAVELHQVRHDRVVLTGAPRFDEWFRRVPSRSAPTFKEQVGLNPDLPYLLYVCSSPFITRQEVSFVEEWLRALRTCGNPALEEIGVLIRPHPQNALQWQDVDLDDANAAIWPRAGAQVTDGGSKSDFYDSIAHSAAVVGVNTSALIEAAILGRGVFTVLAPEFEGTQQGTLHYHYLREENGGFLREARTFAEHVVQLEAVVSGEPPDPAQARSFVKSFVRPLGLGMDASEALAKEVERADIVGFTQERASQAASLVHLVLAPAAACLRWRDARRRRGPLRRRFATSIARNAATLQFARWLLGHLAITETQADRAVESREARGTFELADRQARRIFATASDRVVVGPWPGDAATEVLYWIPYVRWLAEHHEVPPARLVAISDCGVPSWYEGLANICFDGSRQPGIPSGVVATVVHEFAAGLVEPGSIIRRSRYSRLPAPPRTLADPLPAEYAVLVTDVRGNEDDTDQDITLEAVAASRLAERMPIVFASGDLGDITIDGASLLGRREDDNPVATLSALVSGAHAVIGPPHALAITLSVCHAVRTIALCSDSLRIDWPRVDLLVRVASSLGSPFSLVHVTHAGLPGRSSARPPVSRKDFEPRFDASVESLPSQRRVT